MLILTTYPFQFDSISQSRQFMQSRFDSIPFLKNGFDSSPFLQNDFSPLLCALVITIENVTVLFHRKLTENASTKVNPGIFLKYVNQSYTYMMRLES